MKFTIPTLEVVTKNDTTLFDEKKKREEKYYFDDYFKCWRTIFMNSKRYAYNYDIEECNQLFKKGVFPIGCGVGDKGGRVFHVFTANRRYFDTVRLINYEMDDKRQSNM